MSHTTAHVCVCTRVCVYMCVYVCECATHAVANLALFHSSFLSICPVVPIYISMSFSAFLRPYVLLVTKHFCTATKIKQVHHCRWSQPSLPLSSHLKKYTVPTCALCFSAFMFKYGNAFKESVVYVYNRNFTFLRIDKIIILMQEKNVYFPILSPNSKCLAMFTKYLLKKQDWSWSETLISNILNEYFSFVLQK